jgi:hypothetical protein
MITHYQTFDDARGNNIPNCEIETGQGVKVYGAFENDAALWVQLNKIRVIVVENVGGSWVYYGVCEWTGAVAVKPDQAYDVVSDVFTLPKGEYGVLMNFRFTTAPQESGLYYQDGPFDLEFYR